MVQRGRRCSWWTSLLWSCMWKPPGAPGNTASVTPGSTEQSASMGSDLKHKFNLLQEILSTTQQKLPEYKRLRLMMLSLILTDLLWFRHTVLFEKNLSLILMLSLILLQLSCYYSYYFFYSTSVWCLTGMCNSGLNQTEPLHQSDYKITWSSFTTRFCTQVFINSPNLEIFLKHLN